MLTITIPAKEMFDERTNEFISFDEQVLELEHSLLSISKWESINKKPFLSTNKTKTKEETLSYIKCMTLNKVNDDIYYALTDDDISKVNSYISDSMTATFFNDKEKPPLNRKPITSEVIYYWMVSLQIPFECENWHFNRLMTLIKVCNEENKPRKKTSMYDRYSRNNALNKSRKAHK